MEQSEHKGRGGETGGRTGKTGVGEYRQVWAAVVGGSAGWHQHRVGPMGRPREARMCSITQGSPSHETAQVLSSLLSWCGHLLSTAHLLSP